MKQFKVAMTPGDYKTCHALMKKEGIKKQTLNFPTLMLLDGDELIGFCGTEQRPDMVIAGPLVLRSDRRRTFTALRIAAEYESTMRMFGIKSFIFSAEKGSTMEAACDRYLEHMPPYAETKTRKFYLRKLDDGKQGIST